jgi:hypothetical protein
MIPGGEASLANAFSVENKLMNIKGLSSEAESFRKACRNAASIADRSGGAAPLVPYCQP